MVDGGEEIVCSSCGGVRPKEVGAEYETVMRETFGVAGDSWKGFVFDPATIIDHATYEKPNVLSSGMREVFVNGVEVVRDDKHTGAKPGRVVGGPGYTPDTP